MAHTLTAMKAANAAKASTLPSKLKPKVAAPAVPAAPVFSDADIQAILKEKLNARDFGAIDAEKMKGNVAYYKQQGKDKLLADITGLNTQYDKSQMEKDTVLKYLKNNLNATSYGRIDPEKLSQYGDYYAAKGGISALAPELKTINDTFAQNQAAAEKQAAEAKAARDALVQSRLGALKTELNPTIFGRLDQSKLNEFGNYYADKGEDVLKKEAADLNNQFYKQFYDAQQKAQPQAQQSSQVGPVKTGAPNKVNPVQQVQQGSQPMPQKARPQQSQQIPQKARPQQGQTAPNKVR